MILWAWRTSAPPRHLTPSQASRLDKSTVRKRLAMLCSAPIGNATGPIRTRPHHDLIKKGESCEMDNSEAEGAGLSADSTGDIYFLDANGTFDTTLDGNGFPVNGDYGNAIMKLSTKKGQLAVADYFNMYNTVPESDADEDLGSGGAMVIPNIKDSSGVVHQLVVGAGKDANIYLANRANMGKFNPNNNNQLYQELTGALAGSVFSAPAFTGNRIYYGAAGDNIKAFAFNSSAKLNSTPQSQTGTSFGYPGATPQHLRQFEKQFDPVGGRELCASGAACLQCQ